MTHELEHEVLDYILAFRVLFPKWYEIDYVEEDSENLIPIQDRYNIKAVPTYLIFEIFANKKSTMMGLFLFHYSFNSESDVEIFIKGNIDGDKDIIVICFQVITKQTGYLVTA